MVRPPPISTRTDPLFPYTTLFPSPFPDKLAASGFFRNPYPRKSALLQRCLQLLHRRGARHAARKHRQIISNLVRSEEHTSELQSLMRNSYAVVCLKKKNRKTYKKLQQKKQTYHKQEQKSR